MVAIYLSKYMYIMCVVAMVYGAQRTVWKTVVITKKCTQCVYSVSPSLPLSPSLLSLDLSLSHSTWP